MNIAYISIQDLTNLFYTVYSCHMFNACVTFRDHYALQKKKKQKWEKQEMSLRHTIGYKSMRPASKCRSCNLKEVNHYG